jgi:hypothetical protein
LVLDDYYGDLLLVTVNGMEYGDKTRR